MMNVKTYKQGGSVLIPIPTSFEVKENVEFIPNMDGNGVLSFVPAHENIFSQKPEYDVQGAIRKMGTQDNDELVGKENVWK